MPSTGTAVRRPDPTPVRPTRWEERVASGAGRVAAAISIWLVIAILLTPLPFARGAVETISSVLGVTNLPTTPSPFSVVLVAVVASGLLRRQRAAMWFVVVVWQAPVAVLSIAVVLVRFVEPDRGHPVWLGPADRVLWIVSGVVAILSVGVLVSARRGFSARVARGAWWRALAVLAGGVVTASVLGVLLLQVSHGTLDTHRDRFGWAVSLALGLEPGVPPLRAVGNGPHWIGVLIALVSAAGIIAAISVFLRATPHDPRREEGDELAVRRLLLEHPGDDSLEYFATRDDREAVFSPDGRAAVSFRVVAGVCLAAGDPIGETDCWPAAIEAWLARARRYGWIPAVLSASDRGARAYQTIGLHPLALGDEAILTTRTFDPRATAMRPVRHAANRPRAAGYTVRVRRLADIPSDELAAIAAAADAWRDGDERGFTMALSRFGDPRDPREVVVTAHDGDGDLRGVLSFVPWGRRGLSLDTMRRSPAAVGGVTEFMVTELIAQAGTMGVERLSLNFAMFREAFEHGARIGATPTQRATRRLLMVASRWWQLDSLYRSNEKYLPDWRPRFLCFENSAQLTQIMLASGQAEGFLPRPPRLLRRRDRAPSLAAPARRGALAASVVAQEREVLASVAPERRLTDQQRARRAKLALLRDAGMDPYPVSVPRTASPREIASGPRDRTLSVTGRVVRMRDLGGAQFAVLRDGLDEAQVMLTADRPASAPGLWRRAVDLADQVSVTGTTTVSRSGEPTLHVEAWTMAAKALTSPPDKHRGLSDPETRVRNRHVDLALGDGPARVLRGRSDAVWALRRALVDKGFQEVETPVLQAVHGGANARPFTTHINAYDTDLYLRIAPELFLKRLVIGGMDRVFEVARNFRNEGVDATHNPEFTALEAYQAWADYDVMRELTRDLVVAAAVAVHGEPVAHRPDGTVVRLDGDWPVITVHDAVARATGAAITPDTSVEELIGIAGGLGVHVPPGASAGEIVAELYDELVEPATREPTFYTDFPVETSPLTRAHRRDPRLAERWDLVAFGAELGTAYSELVDPVDQRERLTAQSLKAAAGDVEAMEVDEDFLSALEFAMPPTGGLGIGVDRVYMMLIGASIRETLAFPFVRPSR